MTNSRNSAILLAAGYSSRMGKLKALFSWQGIPLIQYQIEQMKKAEINEIIVVLGYKAQKIEKVIANLGVKTIYNEHYDQGKSSSVREGAACIQKDVEGIIVSAVDQPVPSHTLKKLLQHLKETKRPIVIPVYQGKRGHPILFHGNLRHELKIVNEETKGLRNVIRKHDEGISYMAVNDPSILLNFNKPDDYLMTNLKGGLQ